MALVRDKTVAHCVTLTFAMRLRGLYEPKYRCGMYRQHKWTKMSMYTCIQSLRR